MAKYKLQEMSDMRDEGKRRVYPKMVTNRTLSRKEFGSGIDRKGICVYYIFSHTR